MGSIMNSWHALVVGMGVSIFGVGLLSCKGRGTSDSSVKRTTTSGTRTVGFQYDKVTLSVKDKAGNPVEGVLFSFQVKGKTSVFESLFSFGPSLGGSNNNDSVGTIGKTNAKGEIIMTNAEFKVKSGSATELWIYSEPELGGGPCPSDNSKKYEFDFGIIKTLNKDNVYFDRGDVLCGLQIAIKEDAAKGDDLVLKCETTLNAAELAARMQAARERHCK
jgi:hypothetical protein